MIKAIEESYTHIISHPGDGTAKLLFEPIVQAAKPITPCWKSTTALLKPCRNKVEAKPNNLEIPVSCKQYEVPVILGSDANIHSTLRPTTLPLSWSRKTRVPGRKLILNLTDA